MKKEKKVQERERGECKGEDRHTFSSSKRIVVSASEAISCHKAAYRTDSEEEIWYCYGLVE